jgi:hypothetical protein
MPKPPSFAATPAPSPSTGPTTPGPAASSTPKPTPKPTPTPAPADPGPLAGDDYFRTNDAYKVYGYMDFPVFDDDIDRGGPTFSDGSEFRTKAIGRATHGDLAATSVACADGSGRYCLRYFPHHDGPFRDVFTYTIVDAGGKTSTATVTIDVP